MEIKKDIAGGKATLALAGRLDTVTACQLEAELEQMLPQANEVELDLARLTYVSSAGLRVLLAAQKKLDAKAGALLLSNVQDSVLEVLRITGFADILRFA